MLFPSIAANCVFPMKFVICNFSCKYNAFFETVTNAPTTIGSHSILRLWNGCISLPMIGFGTSWLSQCLSSHYSALQIWLCWWWFILWIPSVGEWYLVGYVATFYLWILANLVWDLPDHSLLLAKVGVHITC